MESTNEYKIEKDFFLWHIKRAYYTGFWIFRRKIWVSEYPYYWYKEDAIRAFEKLK